MDTTGELLIELTRRGISLRVSDGQIRYSAPRDALTPEMRSEISRHKLEIMALYSGLQISDSLSRIADFWCADVECWGDGDMAWAWIKASDHWPIIKAAEDEANRIGKHGNPDDLNAACREWIAAWVNAIAAWMDGCRHMDRVVTVRPGAVQSKNHNEYV
jgi:hypothetical protein